MPGLINPRLLLAWRSTAKDFPLSRLFLQKSKWNLHSFWRPRCWANRRLVLCLFKQNSFLHLWLPCLFRTSFLCSFWNFINHFLYRWLIGISKSMQIPLLVRNIDLFLNSAQLIMKLGNLNTPFEILTSLSMSSFENTVSHSIWIFFLDLIHYKRSVCHMITLATFLKEILAEVGRWAAEWRLTHTNRILR